MFCKVCGREIDDDSKFCTYCGNPVEKGTEILGTVSNRGDVWEEKSSDIDIIPGWDTGKKEVPEKKKGKIVMVLITTVSVLAVVGAVVVGMEFFMKARVLEEAPEEITVGEKIEELKMEEEEKKIAETATEVTMEIFPDSPSEISGGEIKETPGEEIDRKMKSMKSGETSVAQPTPEETKASLMTDEPDVSKLHKANVIAANASSTISQEGTSNSPMLLFDGKEDTNWQEGVDGYGIYETISFSFDDFYKVKYIGFKLGNWKTDRYYAGNAKPKTMTLTFGDYIGQITFTGERKVEWVEVNKAVNANSMNISIDDVYPGTQWEDTCITEIMVYGE